mmetsp:Transcript_17239/g.29036  ORF Transcript_17239/g.29036 Transcript_17239/m.29036 type:complete len:244 (+) Transcript_17239:669-1400(+)
MDARVGHQIGLELGHVHVQRAVKAQGRGQRGNDLGDEAVQVGVRGTLNVEGATANIIHGLIVEHDRHVGVLQERVGREHRVVGLHHSGGDLRRGVNSEAELGLFAIVDRKALQQKRAQARSSTTTNGVEYKESLETGAVVGQLANTVEAQVNNLFPDGVVAAGEVVGGVFLSRDQLLGVEQLAVGTSADLINDGGLEINKHGARNVLAGTGLREESVEGVVAAANGLVGGHLPVRLNAMLKAV